LSVRKRRWQVYIFEEEGEEGTPAFSILLINAAGKKERRMVHVPFASEENGLFLFGKGGGGGEKKKKKEKGIAVYSNRERDAPSAPEGEETTILRRGKEKRRGKGDLFPAGGKGG